MSDCGCDHSFSIRIVPLLRSFWTLNVENNGFVFCKKCGEPMAENGRKKINLYIRIMGGALGALLFILIRFSMISLDFATPKVIIPIFAWFLGFYITWMILASFIALYMIGREEKQVREHKDIL